MQEKMNKKTNNNQMKYWIFSGIILILFFGIMFISNKSPAVSNEINKPEVKTVDVQVQKPDMLVNQTTTFEDNLAEVMKTTIPLLIILTVAVTVILTLFNSFRGAEP